MMGRRASRSPIFNVFIVKVALNLYFPFSPYVVPADRVVSFVDSAFRKFLLERMFRSVSGFPERRLCAGRVELL